MNEKKATVATLIGLLGLDALYMKTTLSIAGTRDLLSIGPHNLPFLLSIILAVLCLIKLIQTIVKKDVETNIFPKLGDIGATIVLTALLFISWKTIGLFYVNCFVYLVSLLTLFRRKLGLTVKHIIFNCASAAIMTGVIYFVFGKLMNVDF